MTPMPAVLHLLAHTGLAASRVKAALWAAGQGFAGVTHAGLCAQYPRHDIAIAAAPEAVYAQVLDPARMVRWMGEHARLEARSVESSPSMLPAC
jgi:hypothetical protein